MGSGPRDCGPGRELSYWGVVLGTTVLVGK